jgi:hypothetical protein
MTLKIERFKNHFERITHSPKKKHHSEELPIFLNSHHHFLIISIIQVHKILTSLESRCFFRFYFYKTNALFKKLLICKLVACFEYYNEANKTSERNWLSFEKKTKVKIMKWGGWGGSETPGFFLEINLLQLKNRKGFKWKTYHNFA